MTKFCPDCGEKLVDDAKFCKNCGKNLEDIQNQQQNQQNQQQFQQQTANPQGFQVPVAEKDYTIHTVLGCIGAFFIPLIGFIVGIYLYTRKDSPKAKTYAAVVLGFSVLMFIIWFFLNA